MATNLLQQVVNHGDFKPTVAGYGKWWLQTYCSQLWTMVVSDLMQLKLAAGVNVYSNLSPAEVGLRPAAAGVAQIAPGPDAVGVGRIGLRPAAVGVARFGLRPAAVGLTQVALSLLELTLDHDGVLVVCNGLLPLSKLAPHICSALVHKRVIWL